MDIVTDYKKTEFDYHQIIQSWFSPNFPIGSYNFSHGLETAIEIGFVQNSLSLETWISDLVFYGSGKTDCILLANSYEGLNINDLAFALCSSKERWLETTQLGKSFGKNIKENWGYNIEDNLSFPVAIGKAGAHFLIPLEHLIIAFLQSFVSNLIIIGIKHIPLGQSDGQKILINLIPIIKQQALIYKDYKLTDIGSASFISDLTSMLHETEKNRIYQT
jgi:urease accessory protein